MKRGYPQFTRTAQQGEQGVNVVSHIINETFGWLFKRNHQEHDFGIDGQIEVVHKDGIVTGQMLAVQIKYGKSFFQEKNKWGYIYRGEIKHFNYLSNYPIPVLVVICHPKSEECYWVKFEPEQVQLTKAGWKIDIPFENKLQTNKPELEALLYPAKDTLAELEEYWDTNNLLRDFSYLHFVIDKLEIEALDIMSPRAFFDRLLVTKELAYKSQGKVEISFHGYYDDPRELFEIEEVRRYVELLDPTLPELFFFVRTASPTHTLKIFALCQTDISWVDGRSNSTVTRKVLFDTTQLGDFLMRHWDGLNRMTEWLSMSLDENKKISFAVMKCIGIEVPKEASGKIC